MRSRMRFKMDSWISEKERGLYYTHVYKVLSDC